uniref:Reverse transcriptase/retrotransposon-derived protein RNase H-like domain-containing protein n=1 Tax=Gadus morhua TaxID=8049 RepID=A0A8C5CA40_GADMO
MANFCRQCIFEYRAMEAVLRKATLNDKPVHIVWSEEINIAFESLRKALSTAPALGLPDYSLPFHLFVSECNGHANGILSQQHCSGKRPVAYYSTFLPPVVLGMPGCLRSVAAAAVMVEKSSPIVLDHDCTIYEKLLMTLAWPGQMHFPWYYIP